MGSLKSARDTNTPWDAVLLKGTGPVFSKVVLGASEAGAVGPVVPLVSFIQVAPVEANFSHCNNVQLKVNDGLDDSVTLIFGVSRQSLGEVIDILER